MLADMDARDGPDGLAKVLFAIVDGTWAAWEDLATHPPPSERQSTVAHRKMHEFRARFDEHGGLFV